MTNVKMEYDIITFGSATHDIFLSSRKFQEIESDKFITKKGLCVPLGSKIFMDEVFFAMGGCGTNTAATFGRQGFKTAYLGAIGQDYTGELVIKVLQKNKVSLDLLQETQEYPTALSIILSLPGSDRSILEKEGACHFLTKEDIPFDKIETSWFYLASLSGESAKVFEPLINFACEKGIKLAVNPGKRQLGEDLELLRGLLDKIDILIVNQEEAARLTQIDFRREADIFQKLDEWVQGIVVMSKGPQGVTVSDGQYLYSAGIPKSDLIDRTGAGDAFGSGFVAGYLAKDDISYAIQLATANATGCVQQFGAVNGLLKKGQWGLWEKVKVEKKKI
ncbi:MAG: carbohydrate kinase family protein [Patescibacteria group bacterium]